MTITLKCIQCSIKENQVVSERFFKTLKNSIYKNMTAVLKNVYIDKLNEIVDKYNNIYNGKVKMNPASIKSCTYIDYGFEHNDKDLKL